MNMEIIFKDESSKLFGSTKMIGIGRRQSKLIYGSKARHLREQAHLTVEQLSNELNLKESVIKKLENQKISFDEKLFNKYADKFNVIKKYFFDLDLDTLKKNAIVPKSNHISRTRNGLTTGERASFAIIFDDMTKGAEEANNDSVHKGIYDKWLTEWLNRRDGLNVNLSLLVHSGHQKIY